VLDFTHLAIEHQIECRDHHGPDSPQGTTL